VIRPLFVAAALVMAPASLAAAPDFATQRYACDRGVMVPATYVNVAEGGAAEGGIVVLHVDGTQITLVAEPSASGARYGWPSGGSGYVWWTKGDAATLYWKTPEGEDAILTCAVSG
jgi:membrane-bound inhibitor of C-type lysozyme